MILTTRQRGPVTGKSYNLMNFESTISKTSAIDPSVSFVLRRMTRGRRVQFDLAMAPLLMKDRDLREEGELLEEELKPHREKAKSSPCTCGHPEIEHDTPWWTCKVEGCACRIPTFPRKLQRKLDDLYGRQFKLNQTEFKPALIRWGLLEVRGLDIDGSPATVESLIDAGPETLVDEISEAIQAVMAMSDYERKNSDSPITSGAQEDGRINSSVVRDANVIDFTDLAIVAGSSR